MEEIFMSIISIGWITTVFVFERIEVKVFATTGTDINYYSNVNNKVSEVTYVRRNKYTVTTSIIGCH